MTRTVTRRPLTPIGHIRPRHGHKRKGKPVEAWKRDLQQDENSEDVRIPGVNLNAIEQIANGVERMMFSWNLGTFERGQEQAKIFNAAPTAMNPDPLPPVCVTGDDEVHSSDPKADSGKAATASHKFSTQQVTTEVPGPVRLTHEKNISCSILETRPPVEVPENTGVSIRQDKMSVGTVMKVRRDTAACEKSVGTESRDHQERTPPENTNKVAMPEFSPGLSYRGLTSRPDPPTIPPPPPHERTCYPVKENSYSYQTPGFSVAERKLQVSPRKEEPLSCHASTLTHSFSNFCHSRDPCAETDTALDKGTYIDVVAGVAAHTHSAKAHNFNNNGPNRAAISHSSGDYLPCRIDTIETLEVGLWFDQLCLQEAYRVNKMISWNSSLSVLQVKFVA